MGNPNLVNPHLQSEPFFFSAGPVGALLLHGFTATAWETRPLAVRLHAQGYTVSGPLLPGHGTTPEHLNQVHWQDWTAAAEKSYQELRAHCQKIIVGGESMGALVALYLAARHPEAAAVLAYAPALKLNQSTAALVKLRLAAPFVAASPKDLTNPSPNWQGYPVNPLKGVLQLLAFQKAVRKLLPRIHQPLLVVQGRLDKTVHPSVGETILQGISSPVKALHWMENSTHIVLLDQEIDEITRLTLDFLQAALAQAG